MLNNCPFCSTPIDQGDQVCPSCHASLSAELRSGQDTQPEGCVDQTFFKKNLFTVGLLLLIGGLLYMGIIWYGNPVGGEYTWGNRVLSGNEVADRLTKLMDQNNFDYKELPPELRTIVKEAKEDSNHRKFLSIFASIICIVGAVLIFRSFPSIRRNGASKVG